MFHSFAMCGRFLFFFYEQLKFPEFYLEASEIQSVRIGGVLEFINAKTEKNIIILLVLFELTV